MIFIQLLKNNMMTSRDSHCLFKSVKNTVKSSIAQNDAHFFAFCLLPKPHQDLPSSSSLNAFAQKTRWKSLFFKLYCAVFKIDSHVCKKEARE